jgi:hypothetical protein
MQWKTYPRQTMWAEGLRARLLSQSQPPSLKQFVLRLLICLPLAFIAWHFLADATAWALSFPVDVVRSQFLHRTVGRVEISAGMLVFPVRADAYAFGGKMTELLIEVDPRLFSYGAPVFAALMIAAGGKLRFLLAGLLLLLPFQAWGVFFDLLKQLAFPTLEGMPKNLGFEGTPREFIALGYQFGVLILPMLAPVVLAAAFARHRVMHLLQLDNG